MASSSNLSPAGANLTYAAPQGVDITSRLRGTVVGVGEVDLTLIGPAIHTQNGLRVIFTAKQLVLRDPGNIGPVTVTLNPKRESVGSLASEKFPTEHRQDFFLRIQNEKLGTLVSDAPLTLLARIDSSPPTATYKSTRGDVAFYREDDPNRKTVLTVQEVTSDVKPAVSQAVEITSRVTARVDNKPVSLQLAGPASHFLRRTSVIFSAKRLVAVDTGDIGPLTITLDPRGQSVGTLATEKFPTEHRQSFYLQIHSERLGTLVADDPVIVTAHIASTPPTATYKLAGKPVAFHRQDDPGKKTVLTIDGVESDVTPAATQGVDIKSQLRAALPDGGQVSLTVVGVATHTQVGRLVRFNAKQLVALDPGDIGPVTVTLDPGRDSTGILASDTFPTEHQQNFFLQISGERLGTLVSDAPLTLAAHIDSSPPTATYKSISGDVAFFKEGDPDRRPVLIVQEVTSDVKPAVSQAVEITSRVTARVGNDQVRLQLAGPASHLLSGTSVIFNAKRLPVLEPGDIGPLTITLNPNRPSLGTLASEKFPTEHRQSFFLQIHSERLGALVSDTPVTVAARIDSTPPTATYKLAGKPVDFYGQGDPDRKTVLTIESVESDVTPPKYRY